VTLSRKISDWLENTNQVFFCLYAIAATFTTYFAMYAFRKPFTAATYEGLSVWRIDYKIVAVIAQVLGYTLSKFLGIRVVSELKASARIGSIVVLMIIAWVTLLLFAVTPRPYNVFWLFLNGLPLGMIWGIVFSFLEGRRFTEFLGAGMASSFIVSSGIVKSAGRSLVLSHGVSEFWMPFVTACLFIPALLLGILMLTAVPAPTAYDEAHRTKRVPMDHQARRQFFCSFALGIVLTVSIYVCLTIFRDVRDNFAVEIWSALGYADQPGILAKAEIPIAAGVLLIVGSMIAIKNNRLAFYLNLGLIVFAGFLLLATTLLFRHANLHPAAWMILSGFGMYLAYIAYHTFLFERWIALFRYRSNIGYLMYIADAFGYLGSISIMFAKNFGPASASWLSLFIKIAYTTAVLTIILGLFSIVYFRVKEKQPTLALAVDPAITGG
jgi:hypothetical protein